MYTKVKSDNDALENLQVRGLLFGSLMAFAIAATLAVGLIASAASGVPVVITP